jgi:hypothetical protein
MSEDLAAAMAAALGRGLTAAPEAKVQGGSNCERPKA